MTKYELLKEKFDKLTKKILEDNKQILIDSFVEYYGEEYRNIIEKRYNEITFVYYIDWEYTIFAIKEFISHQEDKTKYQDFYDFYECYEQELKLSENKLNQEDKLPDNFIGTTNSTILLNNEINMHLHFVLKNPESRNFHRGDINHMDRIISFPLLILSEKSIIHEINHTITRDDIAYIEKEENNRIDIEKIGLEINGSEGHKKERLIEELNNDKASYEITEIFKRKGGNLSSICFNIPFDSAYRHNFYLINDFYHSFKKYIKAARISENKNTLIRRIGKDNYNELIELINTYYTTDINLIEKKKEQSQEKLKEIINKMKLEEQTSTNITSQQLSEYYKQLENNGYHVRILNEIDNENNEDQIRKR